MTDRTLALELVKEIMSGQINNNEPDKWDIYGRMPQAVRDKHFTIERDGELLVDGEAQDKMTTDSLLWLLVQDYDLRDEVL